MLDVLIRGGTVYDGSGASPVVGDVAIHAGLVHAVEPRIEAVAQVDIDAADLAVVPGFIDLHGHSDVSLVVEPRAESLLGQGVTTQLVGNCGTSVFPLPSRAASPKFDPEGVSRAWAAPDEYFGRLEQALPAVNVGSLVGLGTVRRLVLRGEARLASTREVSGILKEIEHAFDAGALGVSFGLHFEPDLAAGQEELEAVARLAAQRGRPVAIHLRDYGAALDAAVEEALALARLSGATIHLSLLHAFGRPAHGAMPQIIERLDAARRDGVDVTCEALLWPTVGAWDGLRAALPETVYDWRFPDWSTLRRAAASPDERRRLTREVEERRRSRRSGFYEEYLRFSDWRDLRLERVGPDSAYSAHVGRDLEQIGAATASKPVDVLLDLLADDPQQVFLLHQVLSDADVEACLSWPHAYIGLDAIATTPGRLSESWNTMQHHPRHWGATARLFSHFVRERSLLSEAEALRRLTRGPASIFGLDHLASVEPGSAANVVVLDLAGFQPQGTWSDPAHRPAGVEAVIVNGQRALPAESDQSVGFGRVIRTMRGATH